MKLAVAIGIAVAGLLAVFLTSGGGQGTSGEAGEFAFQVGDPGPGEPAAPLRLASTEGGAFDLVDARGERVLLYFQEGIMCQPCWDQLKDIEARFAGFEALEIDRIVTITVDPLEALRDKVAAEGLTTPALSDPDVRMSAGWEANQYGMMGTGYNGHSFVVVGPDGTVEWRADYGGAPDYTMYLPVDSLLADMRQGLGTGDGAPTAQ